MNRARSALIVVVLSFCGLGPAFGECIAISPAGMKDWAQKVFAGRLLDRHVRDDAVELTFDVSRVWKGAVEKRVSVFQRSSLDMVSLEVGKTYVVFARSVAQEDRPRMGLSRQGEVSLLPDCTGAIEVR